MNSELCCFENRHDLPPDFIATETTGGIGCYKNDGSGKMTEASQYNSSQIHRHAPAAHQLIRAECHATAADQNLTIANLIPIHQKCPIPQKNEVKFHTIGKFKQPMASFSKYTCLGSWV